MIIVHDIFVCKPGNASKAAKLFKETMASNPHFVQVMTDVTGQYHRVIMVSKYESLAEYEKANEEMMKNPPKEMQDSAKRWEEFQGMYTSGTREIYKVW
jgi:hypothetical protein